MDNPQLSPSIEAKVRTALSVSDPSAAFVDQFEKTLISRTWEEDQQRQPQASRKNWTRTLFRRPAWTIAIAVFIVMFITILAVGPQRVYADFLKLFGYIPGVGFVDLDQVRVLQNGVTQRHADQEVTAMRGLVTPRGTDLWLEFSDEARPVADAWLETTDGQRFDLINWSYDPDEPGTHGVVMHFAALPVDVNEVTLGLVEGWRIPLVWVQGSASNLAPANIILAPTEVSPEASSPAPEQTASPEAGHCSQALDVKFCIQASVRAGDGLQVLLEATPGGQYSPGSNYSPSMFDIPGQSEAISLMSSGSQVYPIDPHFIQVGGEPSGSLSTLLFPGAKDLQGPLSLQFPAVMLSMPLSAQVSIDLGDHPITVPAPSIDQTVDVAGIPVHFGQARLVGGDNGNSLILEITSDPVESKDGVTPYMIELGRPEGINDRYGAGNKGGQLTIRIELIQQTGGEPVSGVLNIPLISASVLVQGPFTLSFDAASVQVQPTPQPPVVAESTFAPLPIGEPLPMDAYRYTGRALQSGDLLSVAFDGENSTVYAASRDANFAPEEVAVLPGEVLAIYARPDRLGIDYITGSYDVDSSNTVYRQLYTLKFGDPVPHLLVGQFEPSAYIFTWSFDGRFLAYQVTDDSPGHSYQRYVRIIDLNCRDSGDCQPFTLDTGSQDLYFMTWSPVDYRIAVGGTSDDQEFGASDIFLLTLDPDTRQATLANLTQSPAIDDWAPAQWTPQGDALLFRCWTGQEASLNDYSLCRSDLSAGVDEVVTGQLPWNMHAIYLAAGQWVVDSTVVMNNGVYSLRSYDLQTGQASAILEWPAASKHTVDTALSGDGQWLAAYIPEQGGLLALNVQTHASITVMPPDASPSFFTWVK